VIAALRVLLLVGYIPLAHLAEARASGPIAALALGALALTVLIEGLAQRRATHWLALAAVAGGLVWLSRSTFALLPLLLVPPLFTGLIAWCFARSLRRGRVPLVRKVVAALYGVPADELSPRHRAYTRGLTAAWAALLVLLTGLNLGLALVAVPNGLLAHAGIAAPITVTGEQWSFIANIAIYGVLGGFATLEYFVRKLVFPVRPYGNVVDFARKMAALGPAFWRDFFRSDDIGAAR
jgi:uncharacterized membrane protein